MARTLVPGLPLTPCGACASARTISVVVVLTL